MTVFRVVLIFLFSMFISCDNSFDYVIHAERRKGVHCNRTGSRNLD
jgi:hypothetical protein